ASIVYNIDKYTWHDEEWVKQRGMGDNTQKPMSIYELHLGSWMKPVHNDEESYFNYRELADRVIPYVKEMNYTHIELLPIAEHPFDGSWGYQVCGYYAATSRYGTPEDLMYFIDKCHENGIGVLVDWVPAHFPKDAHGLAKFDGTALYEHTDPKQGEHPEWGTLIFNFGRNEVKNFLISNALFWFEKYHLDGLRVDAVTSMIYLDYAKKDGEWVANKWGGRENLEAIEFLKDLNKEVYAAFPGVMMIAEESTSWAMLTKPTYIGGLGFGFKWNMGWMNDFLRYMSMDPIYRKYHHTNITFSMWYAYSENFVLVLSHDEVVHGKCSMLSKMPGDYWQKFANLRTAYGFMYGHPGKKLMFMGNEFGQFIEWNYHQGLDWHLLEYDMHNKMKTYVSDLNKLYKEHPCLWELDCHEKGFEWIDCHDAERGVLSFLRRDSQGNELIFVTNFTPVKYDGYRVGVPSRGFFKEIFNSDSERYGGSNAGNYDGVYASDIAWHSRLNSIDITVPPLATVVFQKQ
ncbi:MAG: 1,4-alpha-glucan branching protein GlgB, partial [Clostridiales bacterium]|nr:1,4-alpha-glucan branching protein GlgB [Clostridiales bacterium]